MNSSFPLEWQNIFEVSKQAMQIRLKSRQPDITKWGDEREALPSLTLLCYAILYLTCSASIANEVGMFAMRKESTYNRKMYTAG